MSTNSFRKPFVIIRSPEGSYISGVWTPSGKPANITISANVQPTNLTDYDRLENELGGERVGRMIRVYTNEVLNVEDPRQDANGKSVIGDVIVYSTPPGSGSGYYKIVQVSTWQVGLSIDHYRYLAVETPAP